MKKYILLRIIKSIIAIFVVVGIVTVMVYTMIPESEIFKKDPTFAKLTGNERTAYRYAQLEQLGYLDFVSLGEMCSVSSNNSESCVKKDSEEQKKVLESFKNKGYTIEEYSQPGKLNGEIVGIKRFSGIELIGRYFANLFVFDHPNKIQDEDNKGLDEVRGYYFGKDHNGVPALMCTGCEYKYQLYFNGSFPFIHTNAFRLNFGNSYPMRAGTPTLDVITTGQGQVDSREITYPSGFVAKGAEDFHTLKYSKKPGFLEKKKFTDNYVTAKLNYTERSMIGNSYLFNIIAIILSYSLAVPFGIAMARNKGKFVDKLGIIYINLFIAIPSLALIYMINFAGIFLGLPDKYPHLGAGNIKSYILPIFILTILGMPGLMTWIRRYMIDQSSSDYVKFARAKGLSKAEISKRHIFRNAIIPIVNGIPASIVLAIGGAIITETVFAIPGMGKMLPDAIASANNNMVITLTFIFTALSIFSLFLGDILLTIIDPRISLNAKKGDI